MKKLLMVIYLMGAVLFAYDALRPTEVVETVVMAKQGDTLWGLCNEHYNPRNKECFNEFYSLSKRANGAQLQPGDMVILKQEIYK